MVYPLSLAFFWGTACQHGTQYAFTVERCPLLDELQCTWCMNLQHYSPFGFVARMICAFVFHVDGHYEVLLCTEGSQSCHAGF